MKWDITERTRPNLREATLVLDGFNTFHVTEQRDGDIWLYACLSGVSGGERITGRLEDGLAQIVPILRVKFAKALAILDGVLAADAELPKETP